MNSGEPNQVSGTWQQQSPAQPYMQTSQEDQIKASRDVRWQPCKWCIASSFGRGYRPSLSKTHGSLILYFLA